MSDRSNRKGRPGSPSNTEIFHSSVHEAETHSPVQPGAESRYMKELEEDIHCSRNIYVYKNGDDEHEPHNIHVPFQQLDSMGHTLKVISERIPVDPGYVGHLYDLDGREVRSPLELVNHSRYVAASNLDKHFRDVQYFPINSPQFVNTSYGA